MMLEDSDAPIGPRTISRLRAGEWRTLEDTLVVEEPLEIRVNGRQFTITMRTPGQDFDLARGLLFAEGVIDSAVDIVDIRFCEEAEEEAGAANVLTVQLQHLPETRAQWQRNLISGTSCGLCGKAAIDAVRASASAIEDENTAVAFDTELLLSLANALRQKQILFEQTGGLHAAGIFTADGDCLAAAEDIGRHNATDKVIGMGLAGGWLPWIAAQRHGPLALVVSGRASFEIVQKAAVARIPIIACVSAASTLAVDLATANNQTLIGFLREFGMTVYAGKQRVLP